MPLTTPAVALCVIAVACDLPHSLTVVPGCDISEETHVYDWYDATESYVFVIDPEVHRMGPEHLARIEASLLEFMRLRVDGHLWAEPFYPYDLAPTVVRAAVIFPDGTSVTTELPNRPPLPSNAEAVIEDGIEVWVEDDAWKAWFLDAFALRIHHALTRERSVLSVPVKAATHFAAAHPYFAHPQVIVVTSRDDASERWTGSTRFPWLVVIGAAPNQPSSDGSREPWHFDIQAQLDLHGRRMNRCTAMTEHPLAHSRVHSSRLHQAIRTSPSSRSVISTFGTRPFRDSLQRMARSQIQSTGRCPFIPTGQWIA